ncbi:MAG: DegT/DnrJ/EryC1/StrS family aminotransferase [Gammaproteobacteria bacterium]|nr:DegT/DnrJ/EryC1/StrS family aminotransferase [Gammaproteobacteria bacterium]
MPFDVFFYNSGAESLAASIISAIACSDAKKPEVMLPAYACPELVSAVLYAGAKPILVDLEYQKTWINLEELKQKLSENTVAIIAVNLFGIPEQLIKIREICTQNNIFMIEDSAQSFPRMSDNEFWQGDYVILSFGRGKPISTLGGGAVLCKNDNLKKFLPNESEVIKIRKISGSLLYRLKIFLYNMLLHPRLYFIPHGLPFLKLGKTLFKPLDSINSIYYDNISILDSNIEAYMYSHLEKNILRISDIVSKSGVVNLPVASCQNDNIPNLIRYPVLANSKNQRDQLFSKLEMAGLGASKMYEKPLNKIKGLEEFFLHQGEYPNAELFADTLLTLPTHRYVTLSCIKKIKAILRG